MPGPKTVSKHLTQTIKYSRFLTRFYAVWRSKTNKNATDDSIVIQPPLFCSAREDLEDEDGEEAATSVSDASGDLMPRDFSTTGSHRAQTEPEDLSAKPSAPGPADGVINPSSDPDQVDPGEKDPVVIRHNEDIDDDKENSSKTSPATTTNSTSSPLATSVASPPTSGTTVSGVTLAQQPPQVVTTEEITK